MKVVVLTGAGVSAESGIPTFRGSDGLWENHKIEDVASPEGWRKNPAMVLEFYNARRRNILQAKPNAAHIALAELENYFETIIITQNIDDLHERAGSKNVLHLHGEILKSRSSINPELIYDCKGDIIIGNNCKQGSQLRPHIVWFGEEVPMLYAAAKICEEADILFIVGTSMVVYPAASLIQYIQSDTPVYIINPEATPLSNYYNAEFILKNATEGVPIAIKKIKEKYLSSD